jgi:formylglycine-generating enzyme
LCGELGGGPLDLIDAAKPANSEWTRACSRGGMVEYPYGATYDRVVCNGENAAAGDDGTQPVEALAACNGGYPGLFDMSGNVAEWIDACDAGTGASGSNATCAAMGGSFQSPAVTLKCGARGSDKRSASSPARGFRCCAAP